MITSGYDCRNKCILSFCQNTFNDEADVMSFGRLFYSFGPAEANDHSQTVTRRDGPTVSWLEVDDRSHETACQKRGSTYQTDTKAQSREELRRWSRPVWTWFARELEETLAWMPKEQIARSTSRGIQSLICQRMEAHDLSWLCWCYTTAVAVYAELMSMMAVLIHSLLYGRRSCSRLEWLRTEVTELYLCYVLILIIIIMILIKR